jgi:hypothetical protein
MVFSIIQRYQVYLVPHVFQNTPTSQLMAPAIAGQHLNDDTPGRALDALYTYRVTELYRLIAATAAQRLGLTPTVVHLTGRAFTSMAATPATGGLTYKSYTRLSALPCV